MTQSTLNIVDYQRAGLYVMQVLRERLKKGTVIYVTLNRPASDLVNRCTTADISCKQLFVIDCVSGKENMAINGIFLPSPESLTDIGIAITAAVKSMPGKKTLIIDSLSTMLIYNDPDIVGQFMNYIVNKMRQMDADIVVVALESDAQKNVVLTMASMVDEVVKIGE